MAENLDCKSRSIMSRLAMFYGIFGCGRILCLDHFWVILGHFPHMKPLNFHQIYTEYDDLAVEQKW